MTLTAGSIRFDLKCGKGAISQGEKCHKGASTPVNNTKAKAAIASAVVVASALAYLTRKKWTSAATRVWQQATPYNSANPPKGAKFIAQGNNGQVWVSKDGKSLIKIPKHRKAALRTADEVAVQIALRSKGVNTPEIYHFDKNKNVVHMEFLSEHVPLATALKSDDRALRRKYAEAFTAQMELTHKAGYSHGDLNFNNVMIKDNRLALIDWGFAANVEKKGTQDLGNLVRMTQQLDQEYGATLKREYGVIQALISLGRPVTQKDIMLFYDRVRSSSRRKDAAHARLDSPGRACGQSFIAAGKTCRQKGSFPTKKAIAAGLGITALGVGAYALSRRRSSSSGSIPTPSGPPLLPGAGPHPSQPRLPGLTPRALLAPAPARKSKTQRMRENTAAAMKNAEGRIAQTAREEVRRIGQIGNTMAAAGEATGMAAKTTMRELRLRTEAARRKYEPGYRRPDQRRLPGGVQAQLPQQSAAPQREPVPIDPRTGQPRRRRAQGFGRTDNYIQHYAPVQLQPPTRRDTEDGKKYTKVVTNPETGRKNRIRYGAKGYKIAPGTDKGDNYCARSFGDMKSEGYNCSGAERNTPLCLSRAKWKCSGKTSRRDGLTPGKSSA